MRLVLADDHALFRDGLRNLLEAYDLEIVAEASNGRDAVRVVMETQPDIVLMDVQMPLMNGLDATRILSVDAPEVRIVMLSASDEEVNIYEAIKSGASGYLSKDLDAQRLVHLLEGVMKGEPALSPGVARKVLSEFTRPVSSHSKPPLDELTDREREVLEQLVRGVTSNRDLANALYVTENTVKYHLRNILTKLHLSSRAQVIAYAMQHRLVDPPAS